MIHHILPHKIQKFMLKSINNIELNYSSDRKEQMCFFSLCGCLHTKKTFQNCCRCAIDKCLPLSVKFPLFHLNNVWMFGPFPWAKIFLIFKEFYLIMQQTASTFTERLFLQKTRQDFGPIYLNDTTVEGEDFSCDKVKQRVFWKT